MRRLALALLAFTLVGGRGAASAPPALPLVPQNFPYAAEVRFEIHGRAHFEYHDTVTTPNECDTQSAVENQNVVIDIDWRVAYNQVTVPVADAKELGRAAKQLHLRVTPTSPGTDQGSTGTYELSGYGPSSSGLCDSRKYSGHGTLGFSGTPAFLDSNINAADPFAASQVFIFTMMQVASANPSTYTDTYGGQTKFEPWINLSNIPSAMQNPLLQKADWNAVAFSEGSQFKALRTAPVIHLKPIVRNGTDVEQCVSSNESGEPSVACNASYTISYDVTVKRHSLYFTKREYLR